MENVKSDLEVFTDLSFSELSAGIDVHRIAKMQNAFLRNIAINIHQDKYKKRYRVQNYKPYRSLASLSNELKTSWFNQFENPTGIYFEEGDKAIVFVESSNSENISLRVTDFSQHGGKDVVYPLRKGINIFKLRGKGNSYISYYSDDYKNLDPAKIHIATGKVSGYFDRAIHNNKDGEKILDNAVSPIIDIKGKYVNLAYSVSAMKNYSYSNLLDLIIKYDKLIYEEYKMMGLDKYNRVPNNHLFGRVIWEGYMHADGWGAAFHNSTMNTVGNVTKIDNFLWGISHEFGHVLQTRPGMKWNGTTEVTNNIFSTWNEHILNSKEYHRLEDEDAGAKLKTFFDGGLVEKKLWNFHGDAFTHLVPMWQLQLYYHLAGEGNPWQVKYFYADIFEKVRNTNETGFTNGELQINFIKYACDVAKTDLTDFFKITGMLAEVDQTIHDYQKDHRTITTQMIDEVVNYAKKYPKPATEYIHYISYYSIDAYKNKLTVEGVYNKGITSDKRNLWKFAGDKWDKSGWKSLDVKIVSSSIWKNVVAYETFDKNNKLIAVSAVGFGGGKIETVVEYPSNSTRIEAVAWDGTRTLVYGKR
jgi:hypothetical protein